MENQFYKNGIAQFSDDIQQLSNDQKTSLLKIKQWWNKRDKLYFVLGGCSGSGKSSLIPYLVKQLQLQSKSTGPFFIQCPKVLFCAYTGKASLILNRKGLSSCTVHSAIYQTHKRIVDDKIQFFFQKREYLLHNYKLIIVDQASMISEQVFKDLLSFGVPTIFIGDHQQLPPVNSTFNIMKNPDYRMQQVLRQLEQNPIIKLSIKAIRGQKISFGDYGFNVKKIHYDELTDDMLLQAGQILVGTHNKRIMINQTIRQLNGYGQIPCCGQKLISISNNYRLNVFNGQIVYLTKDAKINKKVKDRYQIQFIDQLQKLDPIHAVLSEPRKISATIGLNSKDILNKKYTTLVGHFNYGYAITVHASQGSSWQNVMIMDDKFGIWQSKQLMNRFLYTAITRAQESLTIVSNS